MFSSNPARHERIALRIDGGPAPFGPKRFDELERLLLAASGPTANCEPPFCASESTAPGTSSRKLVTRNSDA